MAAVLISVSASATHYRYLAWNFNPGPGTPLPVDSFFDVFVDVELPPLGGGSFAGTAGGLFHLDPLFPPSPVIGNLSGFSTPLPGGQIEIEIIALHLTGGPGLLLRESPTLASTTQLPPGLTIPSFFDVFVELSVDGGQSWFPTQNPMHFENRGQPPHRGLPDSGPVAGLLLLAVGLLRGFRSARRFR